jgi:hypothetical protein
MKPATAGGPYKVPRQPTTGVRRAGCGDARRLLLFLWIGVSWQNNADRSAGRNLGHEGAGSSAAADA